MNRSATTGAGAVLPYAICCLPLAYFVYCAFVESRPLYLAEMDLDHAFYFDAKLLDAGLKLYNFSDPGTPVQFLGGLLLSLTGSAPARATLFRDVATLVASLLTTASLVFFLRWMSRSPQGPGVPSRLAVLAVLALATWPSVFSYSNYFGSPSFTVALGLPPLMAFWSALDAEPKRMKLLLALSGAGLGLGIAAKMTFVALALAVGAGASVLVFIRARQRKVSFASALIWPSAAIAVFVVACAPILTRIPMVFVNMLVRPDIRIPMSPARLAREIGYCIVAAPLTLAMIFGAVLLLGIVAKKVARAAPAETGADDGAFCVRAATVFVGVSLLGLLYTLTATRFEPTFASGQFVPNLGSGGMPLRKSAAMALTLPFVLLLAWRTRTLTSYLGSRWGGRELAVVATAIALVGTQAWQRHVMIRTLGAVSSELNAQFEQWGDAGATIVLTHTGYGPVANDAAFLLWGNYRYAMERFDGELRAAFPRYRLLRIREIKDELDMKPEARVAHRGRLFERLRQAWLDRFPLPYPERPRGQIASGESDASLRSRPLKFVMTRAAFEEELEGRPIEDLAAYLSQRVGPVTFHSETVGGVDLWVGGTQPL